MTDIRTSLIEHDPLTAEPVLPQPDVEAIRRRMLTARPMPAPGGWTWTMTLAAALTAIVVAGVSVTSRTGLGHADAPARTGFAAGADVTSTRRQLQFATPGGTRVIWVFNADFETR